MTEYKAYGIVDGKPRWTIVDEDGKVINKYPEKKELEILKIRKSDKKKYTDEELVDYLKQFFVENGRIPVAKDFLNNPEYPSIITYQKRFGSWNKALTFAKLDNRAKSANSKKYTDKELLNFLNIFYEDNGKVPTRRDFLNNLAYPDYQNYTSHFGSWNNALKMVGLDCDTMVKQGVLKTENQKGRLAEIMVMRQFEKGYIDMSGNNRNSIIDGICPNGQTCEVKSSKLRIIGKWEGWTFAIKNRDKGEDIEAVQWYYFAAFNEDYTEMYHMWRVPGEKVEKDNFIVGIHGGEFNVENMRECEITDKFKDILPVK